MTYYKASIQYGPGLEDVEFETNGNPIEYLWERYGMSSYIASILEVTPQGKEILPTLHPEETPHDNV